MDAENSPGQSSKAAVICIGGARDAGYGDDRALSEAEFFFPGHVNGLTDSLPYLKSNSSASSSSSVATAFAVGLAGPIMVLVNISPKHDEEFPSKRSTEYPNAVVLPVKKLFKSSKLRRILKKPTDEERKTKGLLFIQKLVDRLLRPFTDNMDDRGGEETASDDESDSMVLEN
ncbi:hypothetical protein F4810DRAFT_718464 [Camillea tinctor]|nr:hypothetical protein F4810DRAFT_718464 [Camillea tinctor]